MVRHDHENNLKFAVAARYCICVKGFLDDGWSSRLSGMQIVNLNPQGQNPIAEISGEVLDQTELIGVLNSLYEMHLPLVSVIFQNTVSKE